MTSAGEAVLAGSAAKERVPPTDESRDGSGETTGESMPWPRAAALCASVADALAAAHAHGVVHRDVKAGNVLQGGGGVKVVDFGVAAEVGDDVADAGGHVWGTPGCLPPESVRDRLATPASDVFARRRHPCPR
jgi:serine/threonine protein kinase